jgi:hypothetical protein
MQTKDLSLLLRASGNNVLKVARCHIFTQAKLDEDDHAFLHEHIGSLSPDWLAEWLTRNPPRPRVIVDVLLSHFPDGPDRSWYLFFIIGGWLTRLDEGVLDDIAERLLDRLDPYAWWRVAEHLKGHVCASFALVLHDEMDSEFAARLFPERRNEQGCRNLLREAALLGDVELRSGDIFEKIGWPEACDSEGTRANATDYRRKGGERSPQQTLRARASVVAWLERHNQLSLLTPEEALPDGVRFATEQPKYLLVSPDAYFLELALRWPGDEATKAKARSYYVDQFLAATRRGAKLASLVNELIGSTKHHPHNGHSRGDRELAKAVLNDIAWRSFHADAPVPWIAASVLDALERREPGAWDRAFLYLDRFEADPEAMNPDPDERETERTRRGLNRVGLQEFLPIGSPVSAILLGVPFPEDADDAFDAQILGRKHLLQGSVKGGSRALPAFTLYQLFRRIEALPLTRARANRLLDMALSDPELLEMVAGHELNRIAAVADPVGADRLPDAEIFLSRRYRDEPVKDQNGQPVPLSTEESYRRMSETLAESVAMYRKLGGAEAEERIRAWLRAPFDKDERQAPYRSAVDDVLLRLAAVPELFTADLRRELDARVKGLPMRALVDLHKRAPWLITEEDLRATAMDRAEDATDRWAGFDRADLPGFLVDAVRARLQTIASEEEFLTLAAWLAAQNARPKDLVDLFLQRITRRPLTPRIIDWLATVLSSRTLWEKQGPRVLEPLILARAWNHIDALVRRSLHQGGDSAPRDPQQERARVGAIHEALGVVLLKEARCALEGGDDKRASAALQAMVALHPPSRLSSKLNGLRKLEGLSDDMNELLDLNLRLLRHGSTKEATLSDVRAAFALLAEAS